MNTACKHCGTKFHIKQAKIKNQAFLSFKCSKCQKTNNHVKNTDYILPEAVSEEITSPTLPQSAKDKSTDGRADNKLEATCSHCMTRYNLGEKSQKYPQFICAQCKKEFSNPHYQFEQENGDSDDNYLIREDDSETTLDNIAVKDGIEGKPIQTISFKEPADMNNRNFEASEEIDEEPTDEQLEKDILSVLPDEANSKMLSDKIDAPDLFTEKEIHVPSPEPPPKESDFTNIMSELTASAQNLPDEIARELQASSTSSSMPQAEYSTKNEPVDLEKTHDSPVKVIKEPDISAQPEPDLSTSVEKQYLDSIKFDDQHDGDFKNYVSGSVPSERKNRFFLNPAPVSEKYYYNKIQDKIKNEPHVIGRKFGEDEFDAQFQSPAPEIKKNKPPSKNSGGLLKEYNKSLIQDKNTQSVKRENKIRFYFLILLILIFLSLVVYNYLII